MRNTAFFRTTLFDNKESKPHFINPCCFGEDLVAWLLSRLEGSPFTLSAPIQEDYGWGFWVDGEFWVSAGLMDDAIGIDNPEWVISVNYDPGFSLKKRLFGKGDGARQREICDAIDRVLKCEEGITELRWEL